MDDFNEMERTLSRLDDCDLREWDRDFVDDMLRRCFKHREQMHVTPRQWEHINRMKDQYL
jgi:hypothetical protein